MVIGKVELDGVIDSNGKFDRADEEDGELDQDWHQC